MTRRFDAVVVGSGPGGAVTARALAEAGLDVVVLEEGSRVPPGEVEPYSLEQMRRQYRNAGLTVALGSPSVAYTEGCGVGGGSEVNSGLYHRPPDGLLDDWSRARQIDALDGSSLDPWHQHVERELDITPWPESELPPSSEVLRRGADALGWHGLDVPRWVRYRRDGDVLHAERRTMSLTYLPAAAAAGAEVVADARVVRVRRSGRRATGVDVELGDGPPGRLERIDAEHVFVCAGAIQTPALLQRSGWWRNIGSNLSVHPTVKAVAELDDVINTDSDLATYQVKEFGSWLSLGGSASRPSLLALSLAENWAEFGDAVDRWQHLGVYYAAIQSVGRGRVQAVPGFADPLVTYRLTHADAARLRSGMGRLMHLLLASGARAVYPSMRGGPVVTDRLSAAAALSAFAPRRASVMTVHLAGTVPMGENGRAGADSFGRVHGAEHLHVNDASLLPWAPGVNPQGTLMAVAHRNVEHFLSEVAPASTRRTR
jgi:choline dehydrogenase-like flavoprotein